MKKLAGLLCMSLVLVGCEKLNLWNRARIIQNGSKVKFHYTLKVDGKLVDSSSGGTPMEYVHGSGQIVPGLEEQMAGLKAGDKKQVTVLPEKGYGPFNPKAIQKVSKKAIQNAKDLKVGSVLSGKAGDRPFRAIVKAISKDELTLDLNHPLAGKTLNFDIEIVEVAPSKT